MIKSWQLYFIKAVSRRDGVTSFSEPWKAKSFSSASFCKYTQKCSWDNHHNLSEYTLRKETRHSFDTLLPKCRKVTQRPLCCYPRRGGGDQKLLQSSPHEAALPPLLPYHLGRWEWPETSESPNTKVKLKGSHHIWSQYTQKPLQIKLWIMKWWKKTWPINSSHIWTKVIYIYKNVYGVHTTNINIMRRVEAEAVVEEVLKHLLK